MPTTFPTSKEALALYFSIVVVYLTNNATRLKISSAYILALAALYGDDETDDCYLYYFILWTNKAATRTPTVIHNLQDFENRMKQQLIKIYDDIPASVWTTTDRDTLNRKDGLPHTHTTHTTQIMFKCFARPTALGDCQLQVKCYAESDGSYASLPENSDMVEIALRIDAPELDKDPATGEPIPGKFIHKAILNPDDGTVIQHFSSATFILKLGGENIGSFLQFYVRWTDSKHPELAGPWTGPNSLMLS